MRLRRFRFVVVALLAALALAPADAARTIDFDALTIADIDHAFAAGTLTAEGLNAESGGAGTGGGTPSATDIANLTGFPDLIVPAGFTGDNLPVGISFFGPAFSEPKLLALGYACEQATHARRTPVHAPAGPGESISIP
jgi:Asp-tRNA(Asn)/Glu-tRNA(Gln) amidotransferase A subunit family amidase